MAGVKRSLAALATLGVLMGGCAAGPSILTTAPEALPDSMGGLPVDAPAAPKDPYKFPAVHDMPPARSDTPMSNEDASDFTDPSAAAQPVKPVKKPAKKKAAAKKTRAPAAQAGAATNP